MNLTPKKSIADRDGLSNPRSTPGTRLRGLYTRRKGIDRRIAQLQMERTMVTKLIQRARIDKNIDREAEDA
jgi:hypothetical protein